MLGGEQVAGPAGDDMALKIGVAAEQPEAVLDLPVDLKFAGAGLGHGGAGKTGAGQEGGEGRKGNGAHGHPEIVVSL